MSTEALPLRQDDNDSAIDELDDSQDDTTSISSSILMHQVENGRTYHAAPNDKQQQEAEEYAHLLYFLVLGQALLLAPVCSPQKVLDVGCGTGSWAIEFADEYPSAAVLGVDLSPIQPSLVPPNCMFLVDDVTGPWLDMYDYVHIRNMTGSIDNWPDFYSVVFKHLKSGGWVEHMEMSGQIMSENNTLSKTSSLAQWRDLFQEIGAKTGKTFAVCEEMREYLEEAGFKEISEQVYKVPIGTWPKDREEKLKGAYTLEYLLAGLEGFALRGFVTHLGWEKEAVQVYLALVRKEIQRAKSAQLYVTLRVVFGQKPV
ncbi:S-adenosyl-L-methionine-dependent methyltransferase [Thozetella sp. PMI_491]|nr:S-adenosyl-L-methionine-dependent methyltransferase [Thozetella sp. PMI_491]